MVISHDQPMLENDISSSKRAALASIGRSLEERSLAYFSLIELTN